MAEIHFDTESSPYLSYLAEIEQTKTNRIDAVKTVLVALSGRGMVYDMEAMRQKIIATYPASAIFFVTPLGLPVGAEAPARVDLLIDLIGPGQRQKWFLSKKLRSKSGFAVGRDSGLFRKKIYDRIISEPTDVTDYLGKERIAQKEVFALAGIAMTHHARPGKDRGHDIALTLPPLAK